MKRLLVTGISGFVGGVVREHVVSGRAPGYALVEPRGHVDLRDADALRAAIGADRPDAVLHLAAQSFVPASFEDPRQTLEINLLGTLNLFEALRANGFRGRVVYVSSGDVYGLVADDELPVRETQAPRPRSPYAVSKVAAEALCYQWNRSEGLDVVLARPFNHIGPGQDERFAVATFAKQIAEVRLGLRPPQLEIGDVDVTRDFTDVRDVVDAYFRLFDRGEPGETYNIASDCETPLRGILEALCVAAGVSPQLHQDPARMRRAEQRRMRASYHKLEQRTGWQPRVPLRDSLADILRHWEHFLSGKPA